MHVAIESLKEGFFAIVVLSYFRRVAVCLLCFGRPRN